MAFGESAASSSILAFPEPAPAGKYPPYLRFAILFGSATLLWLLIIAGGIGLWQLI